MKGHTVNETFKNWLTQGGAWLTVVIGGITLDMVIAIIGISLSVIGLLLSHRQRTFERKMLEERNRREEELHALHLERHRNDRRQQDLPLDHPDKRNAWPVAADD